MTKMEFVITAPDLPADAVAALPQTIYLAGNVYARVEQPAELNSGKKNLIIVHEPNVWLIDIRNNVGSHSVNSGGLGVHTPILGPNCPEEFSNFEYGHEAAFFEHSKARLLGRSV